MGNSPNGTMSIKTSWSWNCILAITKPTSKHTYNLRESLLLPSCILQVSMRIPRNSHMFSQSNFSQYFSKFSQIFFNFQILMKTTKHCTSVFTVSSVPTESVSKLFTGYNDTKRFFTRILWQNIDHKIYTQKVLGLSETCLHIEWMRSGVCVVVPLQTGSVWYGHISFILIWFVYWWMESQGENLLFLAINFLYRTTVVVLLLLF